MNSLELFSGAGGLAKGLELVGFKHTALVENNKYAYASLCENFDPFVKIERVSKLKNQQFESHIHPFHLNK